jgi:hypothetical protein
VCAHCRVAATALRRLRGLLGRHGLAADEGLLLRPAPAIHTFFMRFPIDVVFLAADGTVRDVVPGLRPWRATACRGANAALELPAGATARLGLRPGERLRA